MWLGQPFVVELRVRTEDVKVDQMSPTFAQQTISVVLRTADGSEDKITLQAVGSEPGVMVYRTPQPVSVAGRAGGMDYNGTVNNLGLEYDPGSGVHIVALSAANILNGVSAIRVYATPMDLAIAANRDKLDAVAAALKLERDVAEALLADQDVASDPERVKELEAWLARIARRESLVTQARVYIDKAELPIYQLRFSEYFVDSLLTRTGANGLELAPDAPTGVDLSQGLGFVAKRLRDVYGTSGIVPPAAMETIAATVITGFVVFGHLTGGAAASTLVSGQDMFGNEASRGWAAVELGGIVATIVLAPKIMDFIAGRAGRGFSFEISIGGKPGRILLPRQPGQLAFETNRGQTALPGAPRATPRAARPPGTGELPAGASVSNLPARRQGMTAQEAQHWRTEVEKARPTNPTPDTRDLELMQFQQAQDAFANMDNAIAAARSQGVPQNVLDDLLVRARNFEHVGDASAFVTREVDFLLLSRKGDRIFVSPDDMGAMSQWFTPDQVGQMTPCDLRVVDRVTAKAQFEQGPQWTVDEDWVLRELDRRIASGEDLSTWKRADVDGTGAVDDAYQFNGFEPVFGPGDLGAIRAAATRPRRLQTEGVTPRAATLPSPAVGSPRSAPPTINPVLAPGEFGGPSGLGGGSTPIEIVLRSTGGSTGAVLEAAVVNYGGPIRLQTSGLVLEPVTPEQAEQSLSRIDEIFKALSERGFLNQQLPQAPPGGEAEGGSERGPDGSSAAGRVEAAPIRGRVVRLVLDAYCLEFLKAVPAAGAVFRIASAAKQKAHERLRGILAASERLQAEAALHPDGNPASYFHSLRQWAIWVEERKLSQREFEGDFLKHAQRNFAAANRPWTPEVEKAVRALLPNRWRDITSVRDAAGSPAGR
ncbi:MAG TPA: hypothetical protein VI383_04080 [Gemmatimonadales bacterium]|nr:hypothetical protein [Gemmatimonadales bacterium]